MNEITAIGIVPVSIVRACLRSVGHVVTPFVALTVSRTGGA